MAADRRFLIQNGHPTFTALDPCGALDYRVGRKNLVPFVAEPQSVVIKNHRGGIWHERSNIAQLVALNRALMHRGQIFRLRHDAALKYHDGIGGNQAFECGCVSLLGDPPNAALEPDNGLDSRGL